MTPNIIATTAYLNDPIQFTEDVRFTPVSLLQATGISNVISRDETGFLVVDTTTTPRLYAVPMSSPLYDRFQLPRVVKLAFTELGVE
jgi:hypothetical protein